MPAISVIVPARDVVDHVGFVLNDLRHQTFPDLEVVVVDDGSVDGTAEVLDRVVDEDPRIRAVPGDGSGPSTARNLGLVEATAELIAFVDADDRVSPAYLATMYASMSDTGSDVVVANARRLRGGRTGVSRLHQHACRSPRRGTHLQESPQLIYDTTVWNKLIRRRLWDDDGLRFEPGRWINDIYPSIRTHVLARQVDVLGEVLYYWRARSDTAASITESKYVDPAARRKSLEDRAFALDTTRRMLEVDLPIDPVLHAMDDRALAHDLWTYLPMYPEADRDYRRRLRRAVRRYLREFEVDLAAHDLGPVLDQVYRAIRDRRPGRLAQLLAPHRQVSAEVRGGAIAVHLAPPLGPRLQPLPRQVRPPSVQPTAPTVEARIDRVDLLPETGPWLALEGVIRVREGHSNVAADWWCRTDLVGSATRTRVEGPATSVGPLPDDGLHPLRQSGWRTFRATIDLSEVRTAPDDPTWHARMRVGLGSVDLPAEGAFAGHVPRSLPAAVPLTDDTDLVLTIDRRERLVLQRQDAGCRLRAAATHPTGIELHLDVADVVADRDTRVWWEPQDGDAGSLIDAGRTIGPATERVQPVRSDGSHRSASRGFVVRLPLPTEVAAGAADTWQLWCGDHEDRHRVRAHPAFVTVPLADPLSAPTLDEEDSAPKEVVLRPTIRGNVVLDRRAVQATSDRFSTDPEAGALILGGPPLPRALTKGRLRIACVWDEDTMDAEILTTPQGWSASVPLGRLAAGSDSFDTAREWRLDLELPDDAPSAPVLVSTEHRQRFPLLLTTAGVMVEVRLGAMARPRLLVGRRATADP